MSRILVPLATVLGIVYPFFIYFSLHRFGLSAVVILLVAIASLRLIGLGQRRTMFDTLLLAVVVVLCILVVTFESEFLLRFYPILISVGFAIFFWHSLYQPETVIEKIARLSGKKITPRIKRYLRNLTLLWICVFCFNTLIASYTVCCTSLRAWVLYNGFLSYCLFGVVALGELIFRYYYSRRYRGNDD